MLRGTVNAFLYVHNYGHHVININGSSLYISTSWKSIYFMSWRSLDISMESRIFFISKVWIELPGSSSSINVIDYDCIGIPKPFRTQIWTKLPLLAFFNSSSLAFFEFFFWIFEFIWQNLPNSFPFISPFVENVHSNDSDRLEIMPAQPVQRRAVGQSMLLSCLIKVENANLVTDLRWRDQNNMTIRPKE